jgi:hydrogenase maturation protease
MNQPNIRTLILACGNTLRSDDGIGPHLAAWAEEHYRGDPSIRVISRHQWTPDLVEDLAHAEFALFVDCSIDAPPGSVQLREVHSITTADADAPQAARHSTHGMATHHLDAPELLALAFELYGFAPCSAQILTIGAASFELGETFSPQVAAAIPEARRLIEATILREMAD